jgi:GNAT superfamily N-acetyltransferase
MKSTEVMQSKTAKKITVQKANEKQRLNRLLDTEHGVNEDWLSPVSQKYAETVIDNSIDSPPHSSNPNNYRMLIAKKGKRTQGFEVHHTSPSPAGTKYLYTDVVAVKPKARNKGIGRKIFSAAAKEARTGGLKYKNEPISESTKYLMKSYKGKVTPNKGKHMTASPTEMLVENKMVKSAKRKNKKSYDDHLKTLRTEKARVKNEIYKLEGTEMTPLTSKKIDRYEELNNQVMKEEEAIENKKKTLRSYYKQKYPSPNKQATVVPTKKRKRTSKS